MDQDASEMPEIDEEGKAMNGTKPKAIHAEDTHDTFTLVVGSHRSGKSSAIMNFLNPNKGWCRTIRTERKKEG